MNKTLIGTTIAVMLGLAGCGSLSKIDANGKTDDPVFPDAEDVSLDTGTYPNVDNLRQVQTWVETEGMTRDQLYDLLGRPHFAEGFKVREWDYLFHFTTEEGRVSCQFKVLFDKDRVARSYHWAPAECADILNPQTPVKPFSLSGDVGFAFGSATLTTAGLDAIRSVADSLKQASQINTVTVSGHTDRIGDAASNQRLSQQRADSVRRALVAEGIPAATIQASGFGEDRPVVQCDQQDRADLIACLAPNRRVDIEVQAQR